MLYFQKLSARTCKDICSNKLTYYNVYSNALRKLYRSRETTLAIQEISEHVKPGHFDRTLLENIIRHHISEEGMAKVKESEREKL